MANTVISADIIAKEAIMILDNELVMAKKVFRGYEEDFSKRVNGYTVGEVISIRKPTDFTVRDGATMNLQDVVEGKTTITVDQQKGIDFSFSSSDLTLHIKELSERVIKPAMVQLANQVDTDLMALYKYVPNWVGTAGQTVNSYADVKDTMQQTVTIAGGNLNAGDVFTIANVNAVNPVTKADLGFAKQFVVISYASNSLVLYPALIWTGAFKNVAVASGTTDLNSAAITAIGTASTGYRQNMVFSPKAFALVSVPMVSPPGAVDVSRQSYKGTNVRVIPVYDGTNDVSKWRLDILYGTKAIDPRLATRLSGTS